VREQSLYCCVLHVLHLFMKIEYIITTHSNTEHRDSGFYFKFVIIYLL
jgi:hypothetical protein